MGTKTYINIYINQYVLLLFGKIHTVPEDPMEKTALV